MAAAGASCGNGPMADLPELLPWNYRSYQAQGACILRKNRLYYACFLHKTGHLRMISVDAFDLKILAALQDDGRLTNQQLADVAGLSASQCSRRRMRLEEEKVIF